MKNRRLRGTTLVEAMVASVVTGLVLFTAVGTLYSGMRSWIQGLGLINAELDGTQAVRRLNQELREAMSVQVASDGQSLTYRMPQRNAQGDFVVPPLWDGVQRRAIVTALSNGSYSLGFGIAGQEYTISRNIILRDPEVSGAPTYRVFTPGPGGITRQVDVMIVTRTYGPRGAPIYQRVRETLFLRNVPSITN